jgi:cytochrome P450
VTSQWLVLRDVTGDRTSTIHDLHQRYGPCVRVGPNEVSYSNVEVVKELYGQQTQFMKAAIYDAFVVQPAGIFSMRDKAAHGQRRRLLSHAFSQSSLLDTEPIIRSTVADLVSRILERLGQPTDMLLLFRLTAFDVVGKLASVYQGGRVIS